MQSHQASRTTSSVVRLNFITGLGYHGKGYRELWEFESGANQHSIGETRTHNNRAFFLLVKQINNRATDTG